MSRCSAESAIPVSLPFTPVGVHRNVKRLMQSPSRAHADVKGVCLYSVPAGLQDPRFSVRSPEAVSLIPRLFVAGGPAAVFWTVVPIHVDALNGEAIFIATRHRPLHERLKVMPLRANCDSAFSVVREVCGGGTVATRLHVSPSRVEPRARLSVTAPEVSELSPCGASTSQRLSVSYVTANDSFLNSTVTAAAPQGSAALGVSILMNDKPHPITLTSHINQTRVLRQRTLQSPSKQTCLYIHGGA